MEALMCHRSFLRSFLLITVLISSFTLTAQESGCECFTELWTGDKGGYLGVRAGLLKDTCFKDFVLVGAEQGELLKVFGEPDNKYESFEGEKWVYCISPESFDSTGQNESLSICCGYCWVIRFDNETHKGLSEVMIQ